MGYLEDKELLERTLTASHIYGLPISKGTKCDIYYSEKGLSFMANGMTFNLDYNNITDGSIKTDTEIRKQYVSSAGGAVAGGMMFGPIGAMIGGSVKEKTDVSSTYYLIITYIKGNKPEHICFNVNNCINKARACERSIKNCVGNKAFKGVIDLASENIQDVVTTNSKQKQVEDFDVASEISYARQRKALKQKEENEKGCITIIICMIIILVATVFSAISITKPKNSTTKNAVVEQVPPLFNVMAFYGDNNMPINEQRLIEMIGQPNSTEDWVFTASNGLSYNIRTLYYGNYEYKFCKDMLVRISIYEPISYNSVGDFNDMFGVKKNSNSVVNDTGSAYRITNCGVRDLWIGYEAGKTQWVHISYAGIFE